MYIYTYTPLIYTPLHTTPLRYQVSPQGAGGCGGRLSHRLSYGSGGLHPGREGHLVSKGCMHGCMDVCMHAMLGKDMYMDIYMDIHVDIYVDQYIYGYTMKME
jgi:hypothetical protein